MAILKKDLFEEGLIQSFKEVSVAEAICARPNKIDGQSATFTVMGTVALKDYEGTVDEDKINTTGIKMLFDKAKYFAVAVDDIDRVQATAELLMPITEEGAYAIKKDVETAIFAEAVAGAKAGNVIGSAGAKKSIAKPEEAYDYIVALGEKLDNEVVPVAGRYLLAKPEFVNLLCKDERVLLHANQQVLPNGITTIDINGITVVKNTFVPANQVIVMHNSAVAFAKQIDELETYRSQKAFADVVRGLVNYGVKTLRPEGIAVLNYTIA